MASYICRPDRRGLGITVEEPTTLELANLVLAEAMGQSSFSALESEYAVDSPDRVVERLRAIIASRLQHHSADADLIASVVKLKTHLLPQAADGGPGSRLE